MHPITINRAISRGRKSNGILRMSNIKKIDTNAIAVRYHTNKSPETEINRPKIPVNPNKKTVKCNRK